MTEFVSKANIEVALKKIKEYADKKLAKALVTYKSVFGESVFANRIGKTITFSLKNKITSETHTTVMTITKVSADNIKSVFSPASGSFKPGDYEISASSDMSKIPDFSIKPTSIDLETKELWIYSNTPGYKLLVYALDVVENPKPAEFSIVIYSLSINTIIAINAKVFSDGTYTLDSQYIEALYGNPGQYRIQYEVDGTIYNVLPTISSDGTKFVIPYKATVTESTKKTVNITAIAPGYYLNNGKLYGSESTILLRPVGSSSNLLTGSDIVKIPLKYSQSLSSSTSDNDYYGYLKTDVNIGEYDIFIYDGKTTESVVNPQIGSDLDPSVYNGYVYENANSKIDFSKDPSVWPSVMTNAGYNNSVKSGYVILIGSRVTTSGGTSTPIETVDGVEDSRIIATVSNNVSFTLAFANSTTWKVNSRSIYGGIGEVKVEKNGNSVKYSYAYGASNTFKSQNTGSAFIISSFTTHNRTGINVYYEQNIASVEGKIDFISGNLQVIVHAMGGIYLNEGCHLQTQIIQKS